MTEFSFIRAWDSVLGRRHESRPRQDDRVLRRPLRLGGRPGSAARGGRLHDVHAAGEVRRRREPAAAGGDPVALDDVHRERRRRRHGGEDPGRGRHRAGGSVRRLRFRPDDGRAGSDRRDLRRLAGGHAPRRAARERARVVPVERVRDPRCRRPLRSSTRPSSATASAEIDMGQPETYRMFMLGDHRVAGLFKITDEMEDVPPNWMTVFAVADADAAAAKAQELGGELLFGPQDIPVGRFAVLQDSTGAVFQVVAPPQRVKVSRRGRGRPGGCRGGLGAAREHVIQGDKSAGGIRIGRSTPPQVKQLFGAPSTIRTTASAQSCVQTWSGREARRGVLHLRGQAVHEGRRPDRDGDGEGRVANSARPPRRRHGRARAGALPARASEDRRPGRQRLLARDEADLQGGRRRLVSGTPRADEGRQGVGSRRSYLRLRLEVGLCT